MNLQPSTGYRFDGNGYAVVSSRPYRMRERSDVQLKFKTTARDGLLFLAGKGHTFLSVELRDGNVVYQVWHLLLSCLSNQAAHHCFRVCSFACYAHQSVWKESILQLIFSEQMQKFTW